MEELNHIGIGITDSITRDCGKWRQTQTPPMPLTIISPMTGENFTITSSKHRGFLQIYCTNQQKQLPTTPNSPFKHKTLKIQELRTISSLEAELNHGMQGVVKMHGGHFKQDFNEYFSHYSAVALGFQLWRLHAVYLVRKPYIALHRLVNILIVLSLTNRGFGICFHPLLPALSRF